MQKKMEMFRSQLLAYEVQLLDPEYLAKCSGFSNLVMAWLVRLVDPKKQHPHVRIQYVLFVSSLRSEKFRIRSPCYLLLFSQTAAAGRDARDIQDAARVPD